MVRAAERNAVAVRIAALCQRAHVVRRTRSVGVLQLARRSNPREAALLLRTAMKEGPLW